VPPRRRAGLRLPDSNLVSWDELLTGRPGNFDLVLHDLGSMETRARTLERVLTLVRPGGVLVLDDAHKQGIRIQSLLDSPLPRVRASADHLQQAFLNMLNNARDAMPDGGTATLQTYVNGSNLVVEIRDTGGGMSSEVQARVFEPFFTTKAVGRGTGLGLSVSHGIVCAHGGGIGIESSPGKGATFRVTLPI